MERPLTRLAPISYVQPGVLGSASEAVFVFSKGINPIAAMYEQGLDGNTIIVSLTLGHIL